ncbi:MAG: gamma-glutamyl-gamma-aminobutyrate hydrolase family protein [Tistlia sp.]|uniref:gamma-glutamyl-gamma-aminobutyrate hydrolase family protein n=1 Tax=Tistlia sp. TaxID=3057121 RepID=UPI0034A10C28
MSSQAHFSGPRPLVGLPACVKPLDGQDFHTIGDKYVRAVALASEAIPLVVPALGDLLEARAIVARLDGLVLTGSPSNVHPTRYGQGATPEHEPHDEARDATTLPLIEAALEAGLPLFAICRGHQELNVALGGTLHARVHELPERLDHRRPQHEEMDVQYGRRHTVRLSPGGPLAAIAGSEEIQVNSLHWQAIDRLAPGLTAEGLAPDGTIEAISVTGAAAFALGVQWHPEYKVLEDPVSTALFRAFGAAARERRGRFAQAAQ